MPLPGPRCEIHVVPTTTCSSVAVLPSLDGTVYVGLCVTSRVSHKVALELFPLQVHATSHLVENY